MYDSSVSSARMTVAMARATGRLANYVTPDIVAEVTGRARYAEDFRADGMLFCKLLLQRAAARARAQHRHQPRAARCPA